MSVAFRVPLEMIPKIAALAIGANEVELIFDPPKGKRGWEHSKLEKRFEKFATAKKEQQLVDEKALLDRFLNQPALSFLLAATALADQKRTSACGGNPRAGGGGRPLWGRVVGSARLTSPEPSGQRWLGAVGHLMTITAQGWRAMAERSGAGF